MTVPPSAAPGRVPVVIAHRGASAAAAENTVTAFRLARRLGAGMVELDARRCADGAVVVHHDALLADGRPVAEVPLAALPAAVPTLAAALDACAGMSVNIELKQLPDEPDHDVDHTLVEPVAEAARVHLGTDRTLISSFDSAALDAMRSHAPELACAQLFFELPPGRGRTVDDPGPRPLRVARVVDAAVRRGLVALHPLDDLVDAELVDRAHEAGLAVNVWTVDDPVRMAELIALGVDGICTNVPDVARGVVDAASG